MFYLEDKREVRLFKIMGIEETEVERILKVILEDNNDMVSKGIHDIGNC